jgi:hypothetical protein
MHSNFSLDRNKTPCDSVQSASGILGPFYDDTEAAQPNLVAGPLALALADNRELRAQIEQLRADRNRLLDTQHRIMTLLGTTGSDKLVHDLRNVLNERDLLKTLLDKL